MIDGGGDDPEGDVRRVERVVPERRGRIVHRRCAMHERHRTERRFAHRRTDQGDACVVGDRNPPRRRELHEEIVRMLAIDQRLAVERFARLKKLAIAVSADRGGIEAQHSGKHQLTSCGLPLRHTHPPVGGRKLAATPIATLAIEFGKHDGVLHDLPAGGGHIHVRVIVLLRDDRSCDEATAEKNDEAARSKEYPFHEIRLPYSSPERTLRTSWPAVEGGHYVRHGRSA